MPEFRFDWDQAKVDHGLQEAGRRWANKAGNRLVNEAKRNAPVDYGRLRSSISAVVTETDRGVKVTVGSPLEYARYQEEGTGIYGPRGRPIVPVTAKALKFKPKGAKGFVFRAKVSGTPATRFLSRALETVFPGKARTRQ